MFRLTSKKKNKKKAGVNLAPMVDISLSLVIMFVLSIPFLIESGIFVQRAGVAGHSKHTAITQKSHVKVIIYIKKDGTITLNKEPVSEDSLKLLLPSLLKRSFKKQVIISSDSTVIYDKFIHFIDLSKQLGASDVLILKRS